MTRLAFAPLLPTEWLIALALAALAICAFGFFARAKGASRNWVLWRHVARNAVLPSLTIAGVLFGELLTGAVVTEAVFGLNGLGGLTQQAVGNQDTAVLQAIVVVSAAAFVTVNLAVDLLYPVLDPRLARPVAGAA